MKIGVWLREDLRVENHKILEIAKKQGWQIHILATWSPSWWRRHDWGANKVFAYATALSDLRAASRDLGIPMVLLPIESSTSSGFAAEVLQYLQSIESDGLAFTPQYETRERKRDLLVESGLIKTGRQSFKVSAGLLPFEEARNGQGLPFAVFTPFKNKARSYIAQNSPWTPASPLPLRPDPAIASSQDWSLVDACLSSSPPSSLFLPIRRKDAICRFKGFCERDLKDYATQRDWMSCDGTSKLSAALALGTVGIEELWGYLATCPESPGRTQFQDELLWREFYKHMLYHHPRLSQNQPYQKLYEHTPWEENLELQRLWMEGRTGFPLIDAAMNQLRQEGWQHNRMRMMTAMFFTKLLLQPWMDGERFFAHWLFDYDLAANNGGWQWSASTGVDPVPYFRIMSPWEQTKRFDPDGTYIRKYCPQLRTVSGKDLSCPIRFRKAAPQYHPFCIDYPQARKQAIAYYQDQRG